MYKISASEFPDWLLNLMADLPTWVQRQHKRGRKDWEKATWENWKKVQQITYPGKDFYVGCIKYKCFSIVNPKITI